MGIMKASKVGTIRADAERARSEGRTVFLARYLLALQWWLRVQLRQAAPPRAAVRRRPALRPCPRPPSSTAFFRIPTPVRASFLR
jgi:hypothetical protein